MTSPPQPTSKPSPATARLFVTRQLPAAVMAEVSLGGTEIVMADKANVSRPELIAEAQRSNGLVITLSEPLDADFFRAVSDGPLRVVSTMSTGIDHIDLLAAHAAGITVARLPATVTAAATAELTWALVLGVARGLVPARADLLDGHWGRWNPWQWNGVELAGATFGIVGYGAIGQRVARYAAAFDMQVLIATRTPPSALDPGAQLVTMDELAARSDVISLHVPLTPDTALMVDTPFLAGVKHGAILINASRGGIVDEPALIQALDEGRLAGAGLDVHAIEPAAPDAPLVRHPKVLALPHMGSATTRTRATMAAEAVKGALDGLSE